MIYYDIIVAVSIENSPHHLIRAVIDTVKQCNLRCEYCHPGKTWEKSTLLAEKIESVFEVAENAGFLEITLSGGEITLHSELTRILEATHCLDRTVCTLITNGTLLNRSLIEEFRNSNVGRICVSLDGANAESHNSGRGKTFESALNGLHLLQESGKPITVISVAHHGNHPQIIELSKFLARNSLASQHHICAPSYSGSARNNYDKFRLRKDEFFELQAMVDDSFLDLYRSGLYITFNSFWPATGERSKIDKSRTITLVQLTEQLKDCYVIVRPNGDVRLTSAAWGRETIGNAIVGNIYCESAKTLFEKAESSYANGEVKQLPREVEAVHKFHNGVEINSQLTNNILDDKENGKYLVEMVPIKPLLESDLFVINLSDQEIINLVALMKNYPDRYRLINIAGNSHVLFDRVTTHVTLLKPPEVIKISNLLS